MAEYVKKDSLLVIANLFITDWATAPEGKRQPVYAVDVLKARINQYLERTFITKEEAKKLFEYFGSRDVRVRMIGNLNHLYGTINNTDTQNGFIKQVCEVAIKGCVEKAPEPKEEAPAPKKSKESKE